MSLRNVIASAATAMVVATKNIEETLLGGLNPEQQAVVEHDNGPLLVAAVAGSGKTHALVNRVGYLTEIRNVNPRRILAVTFSRKGADEMNERLFSLIGESGARVGTFHSLAYQILREEGRCEGWTVDDRDRYRYCIKDAVGFRNMKWKQADVTLLSHYIALCKCNLARPYSDEATQIAYEIRATKPGPSTNVQRLLEAYDIAEEIRKERLLLTFDDMLFDACELLSNDEGVRSRWAGRWDYVLQDEAQDQNLGQLLIGELLAKDHKNYMLVGDPAQTIFTWRGARPEKLLGFEKTWNAKKIIMNRNYRCGQEIVEIANKVLNSMDPEQRLDTEMICELGTHSKIGVHCYTDLDDEGEAIALHIKELIEDGEYEPRDIVVYSCDKCTNALVSHYEENPVGPNQSIRVIQHTNANGTSWEDSGVQPLNNRPPPEEHGKTQKEKTHRTTKRQVEGRSLQDGQRLHSCEDSTSKVSLRTQGGNGTDFEQTTEKIRSGSSQEWQHNGQQTREFGITSEQCRTPKGTPFEETSTKRTTPQNVQKHGDYRDRKDSEYPSNDSTTMANRSRGHHTCSRCQATSITKIVIHTYKRKLQPRDVACLYRTNAQSRAPEEALIGERLPYRIIGGVNFYERREVRDLLAYLRLADGRGDLEDVARCINTPFRYLGKAFVEKVREAAKRARAKARKTGGRVSYPGVVRAACDGPGTQARQRYSAEDWADLIELTYTSTHKEEPVPPARILEDIVRATKYTEWLTRDEGEESPENSRVSNVRELIRAATRFPTVCELLDYIDKTIKASKDQRKKEGKAPNKVTLTTLHRSKGMEWPVVFVIGANDGILPHARCEDDEEERRLFYVGVTRAKNELRISCVNQAAIGNRVVALAPSTFLGEAGLKPLGDPRCSLPSLGDPRDV